MAKYRIMYWREIPHSFTVEGDGQRIRKELPQIVQNKIDAYAMAQGIIAGPDYMGQFMRADWRERDGAPEDVAALLLAELETAAMNVKIPARTE